MKKTKTKKTQPPSDMEVLASNPPLWRVGDVVRTWDGERTIVHRSSEYRSGCLFTLDKPVRDPRFHRDPSRTDIKMTSLISHNELLVLEMVGDYQH